MKKLSVIVPIYKVETYLRKCVDSILSQDLSPEEYEIILVDDGSPDNCPAIADEYEATCSNVRVVHKPNGGLGSARNAGMAVAEGEFVQFVDSDDSLESNVLGTLLKKAEGLDVLRFNYCNVNESGERFEPYKEHRPYVDYSQTICNGFTFLNGRLGFCCYAWQFLIRRDLLNGCLFREDIYFEDTEWTPRMLVKAERVASTDFVAYDYLSRSGSITQAVGRSKQEKLLRDRLTVIDSLLQTSERLEREMGGAFDGIWFRGMISNIVIAMSSDLAGIFWNQRKKILRKLKDKGAFPLTVWHSNRSVSRKIRLMNFSPAITLWLLRLSQCRNFFVNKI